MSGLFEFSQEELLCFFAVLIRFSVLISILPLFGDRFVPGPAKILLSLAVTFTVFPALLASGMIHPREAEIWGATAGGLVGTLAIEVLTGLTLGFVSKLVFESISFGANMTGNFMGFAAASIFDPHQESQTQVVGEIQMAIAMLLFLALDGHHLMLRATLESYRWVGLGQAVFSQAFASRLIELTSYVLKFAIQFSAPVGLAIFSVNIAFAVLAKTLPQMNLLVMSFAASAMVGLLVLAGSLAEFSGLSTALFGRGGDWMALIAKTLGAGK
jgi:flagellar biosynthetic protein FliR